MHFVEGALRLGDSHYALYTFSKFPHPNTMLPNVFPCEIGAGHTHESDIVRIAQDFERQLLLYPCIAAHM